MSDGSISYGLTLSSEEHPPPRLVEIAVSAEHAGFDFVSISDHYHSWTTRQGHSPFVWSVVGGIAYATEDIDVAVGVTCPTIRIHPAVLAQAAATTAMFLDGRFTWGVGTGEHLNEHILGDRWPPADLRLERLDEALTIINRLWTETSVTHRGRYFTVEDARVLDRPETPPPIIVSAFGPLAANLAADRGDGLWVTGVDSQIVDRFHSAGGEGPVYTQLSVCWGDDADQALSLATELWPNTLVPGQLSQDLRTIEHFDQATAATTEKDMAEVISFGPNPEPYLEVARRAVESGADHIYFHQIGDDQEGFCRFWADVLAPDLPR